MSSQNLYVLVHMKLMQIQISESFAKKKRNNVSKNYLFYFWFDVSRRNVLEAKQS